MNHDEVKLEFTYDKPSGGMWHNGPNAFWMTATHIPTMCSVRVYSGDQIQHKVREEGLALLGMAVSVSRGEVPIFPERLGESE